MILLPETLVVSHAGIPAPRASVIVPVAVPLAAIVVLEPAPVRAEIVAVVGVRINVAGTSLPPEADKFTATVKVAVEVPRVAVTTHEPVCAVVGTPVAANPTATVPPETVVVSHAGIPVGRERVIVPVAVPPAVTVAVEPVPVRADMVDVAGLIVNVGATTAPPTVKVILNECAATVVTFGAVTVTVAV